jgi:hypothetical protein
VSEPLGTANLRCAKLTVVATQSIIVDEEPETVTASAVLVLACSKAKLTIVPAVLMPGRTGQVLGSGYNPSSPLTMTWTLANGTHERVNNAPTRASAAGTIDFYTLILTVDQLGSRTLTVTDGQHPAVATALVAPNTMQPSGGPEFTIRQ